MGNGQWVVKIQKGNDLTDGNARCRGHTVAIFPLALRCSAMRIDMPEQLENRVGRLRHAAGLDDLAA